MKYIITLIREDNFSFFSSTSVTLVIVGDLLYKFYNSTDNPKYIEINKLKAQTKNGELLDVKKLEKVLRENHSTLKKYLDN